MKTETVLVVAIGGAAVLYFIAKRNRAYASAPGFNSLGNVNGIAHSPDITTGGVISVLGQNLPALASWFGNSSTSPQAIQRDQYSPGVGDTTIYNPVSPVPSVLPYSYKQQNIDTPSLLGTDALFTPSPTGSGSSGGYADGGNGGGGDILNNGF